MVQHQTNTAINSPKDLPLICLLDSEASEYTGFSHQIFAITKRSNGCVYVKVRLRHSSFPSCSLLKLYEMTQKFKYYQISP